MDDEQKKKEKVIATIFCVLCSFSLISYASALVWAYASSTQASRTCFQSIFSLRRLLIAIFNHPLIGWRVARRSSLDHAARKLYERRCREFARRSLFMAGPGGAIFFALALIEKLTHWEVDLDPNSLQFQDGHLVNAFIGMAVVVLALLAKQQPSPQVCVLAQVVIMLRLGWTLQKYSNGASMLLDRQYVFATRLIIGYPPGDPRLMCLLNSIYSVVSSYVFSLHLEDEAGVSELLPSRGSTVFMMQEFMAVIILSNICFLYHWQGYVEADSLIDAKKSRGVQAAICRLLNNFYDIVVELDSQFQFVDSAESLGVLLRHDHKRSFQGDCIEDLLASAEDRDRFKKHMTHFDTSEFSNALAIPVRLRMSDSNGIDIAVEMLQEHIEHVDGQYHYLIGIKELELEAIAEELRSIPVSSYVLGPTNDVLIKQRLERPPQRGTPCLAPKDGLSGVQTIPSTLSRPKLLYDCFKETNHAGKIQSIMGTLMSWNIQMPRVGCCEYHCLVNESISLLKRMRSFKCNSFTINVNEHSHWQCGTCGLLQVMDAADKTQWCDWCSASCAASDDKDKLSESTPWRIVL